MLSAAETMPAYDYSAVADIYDAFCVFDGDISFFKQITAGVDGPVLELMAGTGRVSLPLLEVGVQLTCVDRSAPMLSVLAGKLRAGGRRAHLVCADVCALPLVSPFRMVLLPFQGLTELVGENDQRRAFCEASRLLPTGGRFICTSHNPSVRSATIDGTWHEVGRFHDTTGRELTVNLNTVFSDRPGVVEGKQRIEIRDHGGRLVDTRIVDIEFSLVPASKLLELAVSAGFRSLGLLGDYTGAPYDESSSPSLIAILEKRG